MKLFKATTQLNFSLGNKGGSHRIGAGQSKELPEDNAHVKALVAKGYLVEAPKEETKPAPKKAGE
jgi:hypothetical protein